MGWRETARGEGEACAKGPDLVKDLAPPKTLKDRDSDTLVGVGGSGGEARCRAEERAGPHHVRPHKPHEDSDSILIAMGVHRKILSSSFKPVQGFYFISWSLSIKMANN